MAAEHTATTRSLTVLLDAHASERDEPPPAPGPPGEDAAGPPRRPAPPRAPGRHRQPHLTARDRRPVPAADTLEEAVRLVRAGSSAVLVVTRRPAAGAWRSLVPVDARDALTCATVPDLARRLLRSRGLPVDADAGRSASAWERAWRRVGAGATTADPWLGSRHWHDEVLQVVKGGAVTRIEDLAALGHDDAHARRLWDLYVAYSEELAAVFVHDEADLVVMAADEVAAHPPARPWFTAVLLDRGTGLCAAAERLVHALVGPAPCAVPYPRPD